MEAIKRHAFKKTYSHSSPRRINKELRSLSHEIARIGKLSVIPLELYTEKRVKGGQNRYRLQCKQN